MRRIRLLEEQASWPRAWIGPQFWANRLQDWRIDHGRVECLESRADRPMRTVHLLTATLGEQPAPFTLRVRAAAIDPGPTDADTWAGFLVGAGGEGIDYRITALCHHRPARDGGMVCAVDGTGRVVFRDNEHNEKPGRPKVFAEGTYTVEVGEPGTMQWTRMTGIRSSAGAGAVVRARL